MSIESNAKIVSVVGGCHRSGRWIVPARTQMKTLFGRAVIDLREAQTNAEELDFTCLSFFANITFIVPEGAEVRPSGLAILGSSKSTVPLSDAECPLPPMSVDATTIFGRLRIRTTDADPDKSPGRSRLWRRRKRQDDDASPAPASTPPATTAMAPSAVPGVDVFDTPTRRDERDTGGLVDAATASGTATAGVSPEPPPSPPGPRDLSSPIEPFPGADDRSPIHDMASPNDLSELDAAATAAHVTVADTGVADQPQDQELSRTDTPAS